MSTFEVFPTAFFQNEFDRWGRDRPRMIGSTTNKISALMENPSIFNMLSQKENQLNIREIMDAGKVLIVDLGDCDDETKRLFGTLIVTGFEQAALSRARNPQGLLYEISMNTQQYMDEDLEGETHKYWIFGRWAQLETLLHEQVHLWQQNFGKNPFKQGRAQHNAEFVDKCESLGLHPKPGPGYHTCIADGPFALLMKEMGIEPPDLPKNDEEPNIDWYKWFLDFQGKRRKGKSSLNKWTCPECGLNARMGIKDNPLIRHEPCEIKTGHAVFFVQLDGLSHTIYKDKDSN